MNQSCSCGADCELCNFCDAPKCECFCDLYDEYKEPDYEDEE